MKIWRDDGLPPGIPLLDTETNDHGGEAAVEIFGALCALIAERAGQGGLSVERMCELSGVSRAGFYRHREESVPRQADMTPRDAIQQVIVERRFYGYRRVQRELRQRGQCVNAKRVLRLVREDNLLCLRTRRFVPATTDSQHGWRVWPNLARGLVTRNLNEL